MTIRLGINGFGRIGRGILENIISLSTGTAKAVGVVIPAREGIYVKVVSWYDNAWGYSNKCLEMARVAALYQGA